MNIKRPGDFNAEVWNELNETEKKEVYLTELLTSRKIPEYISGAVESLEGHLDDKIEILENIINGESLTDKQKKLIDFNTSDLD